MADRSRIAFPFPFSDEGVIEMEPVLEDSAIIHAQATDLRITLVGEPVFLEYFDASP